MLVVWANDADALDHIISLKRTKDAVFGRFSDTHLEYPPHFGHKQRVGSFIAFWAHRVLPSFRNNTHRVAMCDDGWMVFGMAKRGNIVDIAVFSTMHSTTATCRGDGWMRVQPCCADRWLDLNRCAHTRYRNRYDP